MTVKIYRCGKGFKNRNDNYESDIKEKSEQEEKFKLEKEVKKNVNLETEQIDGVTVENIIIDDNE